MGIMKAILLKILKSWKEITIILLLLIIKEDIKLISGDIDDISYKIKNLEENLESKISDLEREIDSRLNDIQEKVMDSESSLRLLMYYFKL